MFVILTLSFILITIAIYLYNSSRKKLNYWKERGVKYVKPKPLFGNMLPLIMKKTSTVELAKDLYDQFPNERYCGIFQFNTPILFVRDPELIKQIVVKHFDHFTDHFGFMSDTDPYWTKNLFASKGERWTNLRSTMSPAFTSSKLKTMHVLMENTMKQFVNYLRVRVEEKLEEKHLVIEMQEVCRRVTMDVIASTAFGLNCDSLKNPENDFFKNGKEIADLKFFKSLIFLFGNNVPNFLKKILNLRLINEKNGSFMQSIIDRTIKTRVEENIIRPDLIHLLMVSRKEKLNFEELTTTQKLHETGSQQFLTNQDITAQAIFFIGAGLDTTSTLLSFTSYELAIQPEVQDKLRKEIKSTWTDQLTYDMLNGMKYLDMVISESLRKWNVGVFTDRVCTKPFQILPEKKGEPTVTLNVGDLVWVPNNALLNDAKYFPEPEKFNPERFNDENKSKIPPSVYNPFGQGPRICLGARLALLETKLFFCYLLNEFELVPVADTPIPPKISKHSPVIAFEGGFPLGIRKL